MSGIVGIVNITEDSFSDGGRYLDPEAALAHARALVRDGARVIELGPASSHPDSADVSHEEEIRRLEPVVSALRADGITLSVDSFRSETHRWCAANGVDWINDINGFPDPSSYTSLADSNCHLVVMHSVQGKGRATRASTDAGDVVAGMHAFFEQRVERLQSAGVAAKRLILDPGMGFFLGSDPEPSILTLRGLRELREKFALPVLISVSRKSFLGALTGREADDRGAATLAAELFAAQGGADWIRTHDVRALADALAVSDALSP